MSVGGIYNCHNMFLTRSFYLTYRTLVRHQISVEAFRFIAYAAISASQNTARSVRHCITRRWSLLK